MNRLLVVLLSFVLLVPALAEAQSGKGSGSGKDSDGDDDGDSRSPTAASPPSGGNGVPAGSGRGSDKDDGDDDDDDGDDADDDGGQGRGRGRGGDDAPGPGPGVGLGSFGVAQSTRTVDGRFVSFHYSSAGVENVTADDLALFSLRVEDGARFGDGSPATIGVRNQGSTVRIETESYRLRVHDNPNSLLKLESAGGFTFRFDPAVTLTPVGDFVEVAYPDGRTGRVFGDGVAVEGSDVTGDEDASFVLDAKRGDFDRHRRDIGRAMATRTVGAEITLGVADEPGGRAREEVVTFGNVSVSTDARRGNVTLFVSGHGFDGRVLVLNVEPALFGVSHKEGFRVLYDNTTISEASNLTDALSPDDDRLAAEYYFVQDKDGLQVILSLPHYSVHTFTITELLEEVPPSVVAGLLVGAMVVAAGGFVLFRRPKRG